MSWSAVIGQWAVLECDFSTQYGVELEDVVRSRSWRWFAVKVGGLLSVDSRLSRHFAPNQETPVATADPATLGGWE